MIKFENFVFLHSAEITVYIILLAYPSELFQNCLGKVDFLQNMCSALCALYPDPSQADE